MTVSAASFEAWRAERNLVAARVASGLVAVLMPAGIPLDWLTAPGFVAPFLPLRLGGSALALVALALSFTAWAKRNPVPLGILPVLACTVPIERMVQALGGFASPYYAGLNLAVLGVGLVFTWSLVESLIVCFGVVALWLVPALLQGPSSDLGAFVNNGYFLVLTAVIATAANVSRYRLTRAEWEARQRLDAASEALTRALQRLTELDRVKSEFFANVSHELRTPLTLVLTPLEQRLGEVQEPDERRFLAALQRNALRLLRLIDDLLDLARIDAGRLRIEVTAVDLGAIVRQLAANFGDAAAARGISLAVRVEPIEELHGDPHRLEIVLTNLLGNALKFAPRGGHVSISLVAEGGQAIVEVEDDGPGVPIEERERIFERFAQGRNAAETGAGGAGIGLSLARQLAELHGGALGLVPREPGQPGARFRLRLPLGRAHFRPDVIERRKVQRDVPAPRRVTDPSGEFPIVRPDAATVAPEGRVRLEGGRMPRILLAEDHDDIAALVTEVLQERYEVERARDGEEALAAVQRAPPDLVLSDVMMPRRDGLWLCARLKEDARLRSLPVVLLTARAGTDAALEGYGVGADDFVPKPFHPRLLLARVDAQLRIRALALQLAEHERLAAVGTLAAGVGHEVKNPVNAVINGAEALLQRPELPADARELLDVIVEAGRRIDEIAGALVTHASPAEAGGRRPVDLAAGVRSTLRLLGHRLSDVIVRTELDPAAKVVGSAGALNQVVLNLIDNAARSGARTIELRLRAHEARVQLAVSDDGPGVPPELAERIFDPFFSTRAPGQGTGLGLYVSRRILEAHGGTLRVEPSPPRGARFVVDLPREFS